MAEEEKVEKQPQLATYSDFMEGTPPGQLREISNLSKWEYHKLSAAGRNLMLTPELQLHCPDDACNGMRFFRCVSGRDNPLEINFSYFYVTYRCSNCQRTQRIFALAAATLEETKPEGRLYKFGELPPFGPPTPPKLMKLIGPDREDFLKGRRCENQGLGIGAFIYYRRVVETQKNRILEEIIKVSEKLSVPLGSECLTQCSRSVCR